VMAKPELLGTSLFRIYYYDAPPFDKKVTNPIDNGHQFCDPSQFNAGQSINRHT